MDAQPQWEYKQVQIGVSLDAEEALRDLGAEGWELVSVDNGHAYLKRPLAPPKPVPRMMRVRSSSTW